MRDDELQRHLRPAVAVDLGRPGRQAMQGERAQQRALAERAVDQHRDAALLREDNERPTP
jgi:hypothetical protein